MRRMPVIMGVSEVFIYNVDTVSDLEYGFLYRRWRVVNRLAILSNHINESMRAGAGEPWRAI